MKHIYLLSLLILGFSFQKTYSQSNSGTIEGQVIDGSAKTIESATITLRNLPDSSIAKIGVADKTGKYRFDGIGWGKYLVSISAVGHAIGYSENFELTETNPSVTLKTIELIPVAKSMAGVTVVAKRPLIEQKAGKMVVNVDASPSNAGTNALELLEKSPGVSVDNDGNISLKGKDGVLVLIDGKQTFMSGADLANLLKTLQSNNLDQIEIMTNPPAKYDAAGNAGIINIKTKKGVIRGMNGSANASYNQGRYSRENFGVNLNYRNNKLNIFGGVSGGLYAGYNRLAINRKFYDAGSNITGSVDQFSPRTFKGNYQGGKLGMDYNFSKKDVAGIVMTINNEDNKENQYSLASVRDEAGGILYKLRSNSGSGRLSRNFTTNLNYKHSFDSTGRELTADVDYAYYDNRGTSNLLTESLDSYEVKNNKDAELDGRLPAIISIYSAKADYLHPIGKGLKFESGLKTSLVQTDNRVDYYRNDGAGWFVDSRTNRFKYNETINAAYAVLTKTWKRWEATAGLRLENTVSKGLQVTNDSLVKRNYTNLFPNVGVSFNPSEKNQFAFSYGKRVTRPNYDNLNPFIYFLDSLTFNQGNPYLQPQFTNNFEVTHTFNRFLTTTINYSKTTDIITELLKQNTEQKLTYQTKENLNSMEQWGISVMANKQVTKWFTTNVYMNLFTNHYKGIFQGEEIELDSPGFMANATESFTFAKLWNAELSGWYRGKQLNGLLISKPMGAMNFALGRQIMKKKGMLKVGVRDIFRTQIFRGTAKYSDIDVDIANHRDSRQFVLSFNYRFGKTNIAPERRRKSGSSDEQNRAGGSNN